MSEGRNRQRQINIILIGETQSGKSTFAEALKRYEDPKYEVQTKLMGNGITSLTTEVQEFTIQTKLPYYSITKQMKPTKPTSFESIILSPPYDNRDPNNTIQPVNHEKFRELNEQDYEQRLDNRKDYRMFQIDERNQKIGFTIIDTPGLNDTRNEDEDHVVKIFSKLQGSRAINLVLVMIPPVAFTNGFKTALQGYISMFPELDNVLAFVHTKYNYNKLHPSDINSLQNFAERKRTLNEIMGRNTFPHFVIDCDLITTKPIRICITHNTIHNILKVAQKNIPIAIPPSRMISKTPTMRKVDEIIIDRAKSVIATSEETLTFMDNDEGVLLTSIYNYETGIVRLEAEIQYINNMIKSYETDELELLREERFDDSDRILLESQEIKREMKEQDHQIRKVVAWGLGFKSVNPIDWEGKRSWKCIYTKLYSNRIGYFHVKIYTTRRDRYKKEIEEHKQRIPGLEKDLEKLRKEKDDNTRGFQSQRSKIQELIDEHIKTIHVIRLASATSLAYKDFFRLLKRKAYAGPLEKCSVDVEKAYLSLIESQDYNGPIGNSNDILTSHQNYLASNDHNSTDLHSSPLFLLETPNNTGGRPDLHHVDGGADSQYGYQVNRPLVPNQQHNIHTNGKGYSKQLPDAPRGYNENVNMMTTNKRGQSHNNTNSYAQNRHNGLEAKFNSHLINDTDGFIKAEIYCNNTSATKNI
ncbi:hypothetical protein BGZ76_000222 [Entomortierella beljakovae]|nr:hypothetical protein BGZ76_000222 [Entomortierella beljakovae]